MNNRICTLFKIEKPIIQAGMIWCSGWKLASAVSNAGGLGIIGAGSMYPEVLEEHIIKVKGALGDKPYAVNLPMLYPQIEELIAIVLQHKVPIVFTSAGNPKTWTAKLKGEGITVVHVVSSLKFALKAEAAGVDAVVAEGFEAGGHNGRDETTTFCLLPMVKEKLKIPLIAAGGIGTGRQMLAAEVLGAEGFQIGSRFVASEESSAHQAFKKAVIIAKEGDTILTLKELAPVRLIKNPFYHKLQTILGRARAKKGMFEGDLEEGELEIGQISGMINSVLSANQIVNDLWDDYQEAKKQLFAS
jgi:enoyl-[acyl-carrier protein] reductase II